MTGRLARWALRSVVGVSVIAVGLVGPSGCSTGPSKDLSPAGLHSVRILDGDFESGQFLLYERRTDGDWRFGGGRDAMAGTADESLPLDEADRRKVAALMTSAGWLEAGGPAVSSSGSGPRTLEVTLAGPGLGRRDFVVKADGRRFDGSTSAILDVFAAIVERRYRSVLDALPAAAPPG